MLDLEPIRERVKLGFTDSEDLHALLVEIEALRSAPPEHCVCAALKMPDGYIVRGHRHDDCIITAACMPRYDKATVRKGVQGFLTTRRRFVDRTEALLLQRAVGQDLPGALLFSEDLY